MFCQKTAAILYHRSVKVFERRTVPAGHKHMHLHPAATAADGSSAVSTVKAGGRRSFPSSPISSLPTPGQLQDVRRAEQRYADAMRPTRITVDPGVCTGKPCIRALRFPVARLLGLLAAGSTRDQILTDYPYLEPEDVDEALQYAASLAEDETVELDRLDA
jgi:uncharacterized protein (DUF433 family)